MTSLPRGRLLSFAATLQLLAQAPLAMTGRQAAPAAAPRTDHAVGFYDEGLGRVVVVGATGNPSDGDRDAVWSWSGTRWDLVTEAGPEGRVNAAAAYEGRRKRAVVVGGSRRSANNAWRVVGDGWANERTGWQRIGDIEPRDHQSLVEDGRGGVLMFGGIPANRSGAWPADTWELGTDGWARVTNVGPAPRGRSALAYDSARRQIVLFGGVSAPPAGPNQQQTFFGDTWIWNGERWRQAAETGPRGRYAHGMVFDERAGRVLLYSGAAAHKGAPLDDMWQWDGERWTEITLTGPTPGHRYQPVMVYDKARARTVLYGGIGGPGDTWEWDGRAWQRMTP